MVPREVAARALSHSRRTETVNRCNQSAMDSGKAFRISATQVKYDPALAFPGDRSVFTYNSTTNTPHQTAPWSAANFGANPPDMDTASTITCAPRRTVTNMVMTSNDGTTELGSQGARTSLGPNCLLTPTFDPPSVRWSVEIDELRPPIRHTHTHTLARGSPRQQRRHSMAAGAKRRGLPPREHSSLFDAAGDEPAESGPALACAGAYGTPINSSPNAADVAPKRGEQKHTSRPMHSSRTVKRGG